MPVGWPGRRRLPAFSKRAWRASRRWLLSLAVPFLQGGSDVSAVGFIAAMAVSSTIVDVSPFSTNGALVLANAKGVDRDRFFRQLMVYGGLVTLVAPLLVWLLFVVRSEERRVGK